MEIEIISGGVKGYSQAEIALMSDEKVKSEWEAICEGYRLGVQQHLSEHGGLMMFANFCNFSSEMDKRRLK